MSGEPASAAPSTIDAEEALSRHVAAAQEKMRRSVMIGRLQNDPLADVVDAIADAIGIQHELHLSNVQQSRLAAGRRRPADEVATLGVEAAAAAGASTQVTRLVRAHVWRTGVITGVALMGVGVMAAFGGYQAGRRSAAITVSAVQAAAVRDGPDATAMWANLMTSNDGRLVAQICKETGARSDGGRRACALGLWTEPPINPGPRTTPLR